MIVVKKNHPVLAGHWLNAKPVRIIATSFLLVILTGGLLLTLPAASRDGRSIGFLQALFTATSATCVTGLVTVDTATHWTVFGKLVIIGLIQIGGLGLVTITSFFYSFMRKKATLKTLVIAQESTASFSFPDVLRLVRKIMAITFGAEFVGGVILSWRFIGKYGFLRGVGKGFFQSVSAFCNAGFDLHGDSDAGPFSSLTAWNGDPVVILTTGFLIIFGGLGFVVWSNLLDFHKERKLLFHSKVVLSMTGLLLLVGTVFFLIVEYNNQMTTYSLGSLPEWQRPIAAFFQSVTPRTAGFNSIDQGSLTDSSKFMTTILMFIGAAPGSTGGGIKVSTFAVIMATIISDVHGQENIVLFRHRLPRETFTRAFAIMGLAMSIVLICSMLMSFFENDALRAGRFSFLDLVYESTSAFATVGLTSAGTPGLHPASWAVLIPAMYLGRVGPASFALSLTMQHAAKKELVHPEGKTLVG
ncbi:MAG: potassium transporter TrkG [Clostridiaceae bacterium]|nr:potassium transporter TrkG [Clostridiaceae bacterium]